MTKWRFVRYQHGMASSHDEGIRDVRVGQFPPHLGKGFSDAKTIAPEFHMS